LVNDCDGSKPGDGANAGFIRLTITAWRLPNWRTRFGIVIPAIWSDLRKAGKIRFFSIA
jgi:hypothetical protein